MALKYGKKNVLSTELWKYPLGVSGLSGVGKSSTIKEFCEDIVGDEGYLMCSVGMEMGLNAITNVNFINCPTWDDDYDEDANSIGLRTLIDDIVENKSTDWKDLKILVYDTADELFPLLEEEVIRMHNKENPAKKTKTFNSCFGGFGEPRKAVIRLFNQMLVDLNSVNVTPYFIFHTKMKTKVDEAGVEYDQLTASLQSDYFEAIRGKIDLLGTCSIQRDVVKKKTGRKNIVTKQEETRNKVTDEARFMAFRDEGYTIDSKSRFKYIVDRIPLDAKELRKAMEDAIEMEIQSNGGSVKEAQKLSEENSKVLEEKVAQKESEAKAHKVEKEKLDEITSKIKTFIVENKSDLELIKPVLAKAKELGYANPMEVDDIEDAIEIAKLIKE